MSVTDINKLNPSRILFAFIIASVGLSILLVSIVDSRADGSESYQAKFTAKGAGDSGAGVDKYEAIKNLVGQSSDPKVAKILHFTRTVERSRGMVDSETIDKLRQVQVSEQEIVEIIAHYGLNHFTNYFNHVANTEVDFPYVTAVVNQNTA